MQNQIQKKLTQKFKCNLLNTIRSLQINNKQKVNQNKFKSRRKAYRKFKKNNNKFLKLIVNKKWNKMR